MHATCKIAAGRQLLTSTCAADKLLSPGGLGILLLPSSRMLHSSSLNVQLLKDLRKRLRWTQETLADASSLSVRVIAKAEGGEEVSAKTVRLLVEAFGRAGQMIDEQELATNPEVLVRRFLKNYADYQADFVQHCLDFLSLDIVAFIDGDPATNPIAGTYRGLEEFDGLWRKFFAMFARAGGTLGDNPETRCIGNEVLAWGHEYVHLPEVPPEEPGFVMLRMTFEGGRMVRFEDYYESSGMMRVLHHYADQFPDAEWARLLREKAALNGEGRPSSTPRQPPDASS